MRIWGPAVIVAAAIGIHQPALATVIGFDGLSGSPATYSESGYQFALSGFGDTGFGNPAPSLLATGAGSTATMTSTVGDDFALLAFDLADGGAGGSDMVSVEGFLNGVSVFSFSQAPTDGFVTIASSFSAVVIDTLVFKSGSSGWLNLDNINVEFAATSVIEPSTVGLFAIGLAGLGVTRRRRAS